MATAAVHRAEDLNITDWIETEATGDAGFTAVLFVDAQSL
jgi:hypothetical protein